MKIRREFFLAAGLALLALIIFSAFTQSPKPFASAEVQFTDASSGGLAIVPASCPSYAHTSGECDLPASTNCTLTPSSSSVSPGQSVALSWSVTQPAIAAIFTTNFSGNISPNGGSVSTWSGSLSVTPTVTTTYLLSGTMSTSPPWFPTVKTGSAACQTTVTVQQACTPQNICGGGNVVNSCTNAVVSTCPYGCANGQCLCPSGTIAYNGSCVAQCPSGYVEFSGTCVAGCPTGYVEQSGSCVFSACPSGYSLQGNLCVQTCTPQYYCSANSLYYKDASCQSTPVQACTYGCANGACNVPAGPGVQLWQVRPTLVRQGDPVSVNWNVTSVRSCTVTGTNGDSWSGASGSQNSGPIIGQTVFTLTCTGLDDSTITRTTSVNIVPIFNEQ